MLPSLTPQRSAAVTGWLAALMGFGLPISTALDNIAFAALILFWLFSGNWRDKLERLRSHPGAHVAGLLLVLAVLGTAWGPGEAKETLKYFEKYASLLLILCLLSLPLNRSIRQRAFLGFCLGVVVTFAVSYAFRFGLLPEAWFPGKTPDNPSMFKLHITHGFFMAIGAYIMLIAALSADNVRAKWFLGGAAALAAGNALIVQGRTGYLVLATLATYLFVRRFRWRGLAFSALLLIVGGVVALQFPDSSFTSRMTKAVKEIQAWDAGVNDETSSMGVRLQFATTSLRILSEHPLIGVGTGGFEKAYREFAPAGQVIANNPHNQYLLTAVQFGLPGLVLLLVLFGVFWRLSRHLENPEQSLAQGILLAYMVGCLFNSFLFDHSEVRFFAWSLGLLFSGLALRPTAPRRR